MWYNASQHKGGTRNQPGGEKMEDPFKNQNISFTIHPYGHPPQVPRICELRTIMQNEPNSPYRWRLAGFPTPHYAKRTQFPPPLSSRASGCAAAQSRGIHSITIAGGDSLPGTNDPIAQNETNFPPHAAFPTFSSLLSPLSRATARAAQFPSRRPKYSRTKD